MGGLLFLFLTGIVKMVLLCWTWVNVWFSWTPGKSDKQWGSFNALFCKVHISLLVFYSFGPAQGFLLVYLNKLSALSEIFHSTLFRTSRSLSKHDGKQVPALWIWFRPESKFVFWELERKYGLVKSPDRLMSASSRSRTRPIGQCQII